MCKAVCAQRVSILEGGRSSENSLVRCETKLDKYSADKIRQFRPVMSSKDHSGKPFLQNKQNFIRRDNTRRDKTGEFTGTQENLLFR